MQLVKPQQVKRPVTELQKKIQLLDILIKKGSFFYSSYIYIYMVLTSYFLKTL